MKTNIETVKKYLNEGEAIQYHFHCTMNKDYMMRTGTLAATDKRIIFCDDTIMGKEMKWEYRYSKISSLSQLPHA